MQKMQSMNIIYHKEFDQRKGSLMQVCDDFLQFIDENPTFTIKGSKQDDLIMCTNQQTYKLRGINLPTSLLLIDQTGTIDLQLSHFLKLQSYSHQYSLIYEKIKQLSGSQQQFATQSIQSLNQKYGFEDQYIKGTFKISLKEFQRFQEGVDFYKHNGSRLFVPLTVLLAIMRSFLIYLTQKQLLDKQFTFQDITQFQQLKDQQLLQLVAKKFHFTVNNLQDKSENKLQQGQKMIIQELNHKKKFKVSYESILHFILIQLGVAKEQYIGSQMDQLLKEMLSIYLPIGFAIPCQAQSQHLISMCIPLYFIQSFRNNTLIRTHYNPLQIQSSLKGRIKFMAGFKNRFSRQEIYGVFMGLVVKDGTKEVKLRINAYGTKEIDMDDLLLRNFRRFGDLYQIKLVLPK